MNFKLPTLDASTIQARFRAFDPSSVDTSRLKPSIHLPSLEVPHIDMPHIERPQIGALDGASRAASGLATEAGKVAANAVSDAGRMVSSLLESAGERLHDLRTAVAPPPKRPSTLQRGIVALAVASVVASIAGGVAFFLNPARGAKRRAAIRRRLGIQAGKARSGVDTAVVAARRTTDRAADLVRIPIESAKDLVSRNGHSDVDIQATAEVPVLVGVGAAGAIDIPIGHDSASSIDAPADLDDSGSLDAKANKKALDAAEGVAEKSAQAEAVGE